MSILNQEDYQGRVAFIVGGSRGIGRAVARRLAGLGADVAFSYKQNAGAAREVEEELRAMGSNALAIPLDLEREEQIEAAFRQVKEHYGALDFLVYSAAATAFKEPLEFRALHLHRTYMVVVTSFVRAVQEAVPLMEGRGGRVVAISSIGSIRALPKYGALGPAKAALEAWIRYLAQDLAPRGILVNAVSPGVVDTDSWRLYAGPEHERVTAAVIAETPIGRLITPDEVAGLVAFLLSPLASSLCGQTLVADGGLTMTQSPFNRELT